MSREHPFSIRLDPSITSADGLTTPADHRELLKVPADPKWTGDGVTIAHIDSGIDTSHNFFSDKNIADGFDATVEGEGKPHEDLVGHGSWNVTVGLHTFAPDAEVYPIRVFGANGRTDRKTLRRAYDHIYKNSDKFDFACFALGGPKESGTLDSWHTKMINAGVRDVTAAGNNGRDTGSPATANGAYTLGAVDENGHVTNFSSYESVQNGQNIPDVTIPGKDVIGVNTTDGPGIGTGVPRDRIPDELPDGPYIKASGTSMCPTAAFAAASWLQAMRETHGKGDPLAAQKAFKKTARDQVDPGTEDIDDGEGLLTYKPTLPDGGSGGGNGDGNGNTSRADLNVVLAPRGAEPPTGRTDIAVRVSKPDGAPFPQAQVIIENAQTRHVRFTGEDGRAIVEDAKIDDYVVSVSAKEGDTWFGPVTEDLSAEELAQG